MVFASTTGFPTEIDSRVLQTSQELEEFPFLLDYNAGRPIGLGRSLMFSVYQSSHFSGFSLVSRERQARCQEQCCYYVPRF
jgi:hypothetical protein